MSLVLWIEIALRQRTPNSGVPGAERGHTGICRGIFLDGPRGFDAREYDQAAAYAKQTKTLALEQLKQRPLDAEPHLPIALGAAIEVQAQMLTPGASAVRQLRCCRNALHTYGNTSIRARLQKNLNVLSLEGGPRRFEPSNSWDPSRRHWRS